MPEGEHDNRVLAQTKSIQRFEHAADALVQSGLSLAAVDEDTPDPPGDSLASLFGPGFADPDAGSSLAGVAVVANPATAAEGVWQYSSDGVNWFAIGAVGDDATALVLSAANDPFVPLSM